MRSKIVAVALRDLAKNKKWTDKHIGSDVAIKSYSSYQEVIADPVRIIHP
jgi:hypothetical protein